MTMDLAKMLRNLIIYSWKGFILDQKYKYIDNYYLKLGYNIFFIFNENMKKKLTFSQISKISFEKKALVPWCQVEPPSM